MSKVWYCINCGYEVGSRGRCHRCKEKLQLSPLPELEVGDEEDEVGYRLDDWEDAPRGRLIQALIGAGIHHRFEEEELVVAAVDEERVDDLVAEAAETDDDDDLDQIHLVEDVFVSEKDRSETYVPGIGLVDAQGRPLDSVGRPHYAISTLERDELEELTVQVRRLRLAARRLRVDPTDMEADGDVAEASAAVFVTDQFPGLNTDTWAAVGRTTRRLLGALGSEEALEDEISRQAGILSVLLDLIAEERADAEASGSAAGGLSEAIGGGTAGAAEMLHGGTEQDRGDAAAGLEEGEAAVRDAFEEGDGLEERAASDGLEEGDGFEEGAASDGLEEGEGAGLPADAGEADAGNGERGGGETSDGETGGGETVYELPTQWQPEQRAELAMLLEQAKIEAIWDRGDLIVPAAREEEVEGLFDQIHGGQNSEAQDEAQYQQISELFAASSRLAGDPGDPSRATEVLRTVSAVDGSTPFGFDGVKWSAIRKRAHILADSIEHKAQRDVVAAEATSLRDLLRELV